MSDVRYCNTADLIDLNRKSMLSKFNRTLDAHKLEEVIDPDGVHVLWMVLYGHNMDSAAVLHHRCQVMVKVKGSMTPLDCFLDVADYHWKQLAKVSDDDDNINSTSTEGTA